MATTTGKSFPGPNRKYVSIATDGALVVYWGMSTKQSGYPVTAFAQNKAVAFTLPVTSTIPAGQDGSSSATGTARILLSPTR